MSPSRLDMGKQGLTKFHLEYIRVPSMIHQDSFWLFRVCQGSFRFIGTVLVFFKVVDKEGILFCSPLTLLVHQGCVLSIKGAVGGSVGGLSGLPSSAGGLLGAPSGSTSGVHGDQGVCRGPYRVSFFRFSKL